MADDELKLTIDLFSLTVLTRLYSFPGLRCLGHLLVQTQAAQAGRVHLHLVHLQHGAPWPAFTENKTRRRLDKVTPGSEDTTWTPALLAGRGSPR